MSENRDASGKDEWGTRLRGLLDAAKQAAGEESLSARLEISDHLTEFIEQSFPNDARIQALDDIAAKAAIGILTQSIDERLQSIAARNAELARLNKKFEAASATAKKEAASLRLERVGSALTALDQGVAAIRALRDVLEAGTGSDRELAVAIDKALGALHGVRIQLQR